MHLLQDCQANRSGKKTRHSLRQRLSSVVDHAVVDQLTKLGLRFVGIQNRMTRIRDQLDIKGELGDRVIIFQDIDADLTQAGH